MSVVVFASGHPCGTIFWARVGPYTIYILDMTHMLAFLLYGDAVWVGTVFAFVVVC